MRLTKWFFFGILFFLTSCNKNIIFDKYKNVENNIWLQDSIVTFKDSIKTNTPSLNVNIGFRHSNLFSYKKLPIIVDMQTPSWEKKDTIFINFVDDNLRWKGKGWGSLYTLDTKVGKIHFNNIETKNPFIIKIIPFLNKDIKNINDITLKIYE